MGSGSSISCTSWPCTGIQIAIESNKSSNTCRAAEPTPPAAVLEGLGAATTPQETATATQFGRATALGSPAAAPGVPEVAKVITTVPKVAAAATVGGSATPAALTAVRDGAEAAIHRNHQQPIT